MLFNFSRDNDSIEVNFRKENKDCESYLNKMKILAMNYITFKITMQQDENTDNEFYYI